MNRVAMIQSMNMKTMDNKQSPMSQPVQSANHPSHFLHSPRWPLWHAQMWSMLDEKEWQARHNAKERTYEPPMKGQSAIILSFQVCEHVQIIFGVILEGMCSLWLAWFVCLNTSSLVVFSSLVFCCSKWKRKCLSAIILSFQVGEHVRIIFGVILEGMCSLWLA